MGCRRVPLVRSLVVAGLAAWPLGGRPQIAIPPPLVVQDPRGPPAPPAAHTIEVEVPLHDGAVDLGALATALLDAYGLDATAIDVPHHHVDVSGIRGWLLLVAARHALLETVRFRRSDDALSVTVDLDRARQVGRTLRARLVAFAGARLHDDLLQRHYVLGLPDDLDPSRPLVVLIHGVESSPRVWDDLRAWLAHGPRPFQVATFAYPNDEAIDRVAAALAPRLAALTAQPIVLIGHSMGGLIARDVVEDPKLDPGNVRQVILIGVPNDGSSLAGLRLVLEAAHLVTGRNPDLAPVRMLLAGMRANLVDGLGEAGGDLAPRSAFLAELRARPRNPDVTYHVVLGSRSLLPAVVLERLQRVLPRTLPSTPLAALLRPALQRWLDGLDELEAGHGDGAVSLSSGRLAGVPAVIVDRDHLGLVRLRGLVSPSVAPEDHPVFRWITRWLRDAE